MWDVEKVLKCIKTLPTNIEFPYRTLLLKLTSLLFLTPADKRHKVCYVDIRYMVKAVSSYKVNKELDKRESSSISGTSGISSGQGFMYNCNMS